MQSNSITTDFWPLPATYQQVEWIQSDWNQRINTWLKWENKYIVEAKCIINAMDYDVDACLFWSRWNSRPQYCFYINFKWSWSYHYFSQYLNSDYSHSSGTPYTWNEYTIKSTLLTTWNSLEVNWSTYFSWSYWSSYNNSMDLEIFGCHYQWSLSNPFKWKVYYLIIKDWSNNIIKNYIPCYRKSDSVIWMYETVEWVFLVNSWSWTFTKWPDL